MKTLMMIGFLCLTFFPGQEMFAQETTKSEPTLTETLDFLKGKIDGSTVSIDVTHADFDWKVGKQTYTYEIARATGAELILEEKHFLKWTWYLKSRIDVHTSDCSTEVSILLNEIVPDSIKVVEGEGYFVVRMKTAVNKKIKVFRDCTTNSSVISDKSGITREEAYGIFFSNQETAEKVAKALTHAVKLNGGKAEIF